MPLKSVRWLAVVVGGLLYAGACGEIGPSIGSETNFLSSCDATCDEGLTCLCGVCTQPCSESDECTALGSGTECTAEIEPPPDRVCPQEETAFCDRPCSADADCASLGAAFRCQNRRCRELDDLAPAPTTCMATTLSIGENERTVQVGDTTRDYVVYVPESFAGDRAVPLILDFHTLGGDPAGEATNSGYRELADREGFIVVWPAGIDGAWNIGPCCTTSREVDDVAFARALVESVQAEACIDAKRIYAAGVAMGAGMAYQLGCNAADVFSGIAASSFDLLAEADQPCQPSEPLTVISFRGTADVLVPYEGGAQPAPNLPGVTMNFMGAVGTFERWAELNQCSGAASEADSDGCSTYSNCAGGVSVTLCTVEGGMTEWGSAEVGWATLTQDPMP